MTQFGTLRVWAAWLSFLGAVGAMSALAGTIVWAFEVDGSWRTLGVLLFGGAVSIVLGVVAMAVASGLRAVADIGDTVSAR